jgi:hypothetical protein
MSTEETPENIRVRTSDAEREQVAEVLRNAVTEGRLSLEEGDERLTALYRTKFRDELPTLVADLPEGQAWRTPPRPAGPDAGQRGRNRGGGGDEAGPGEWTPWGAGAPWGGPPWGAGGPGRGPWGGPGPGRWGGPGGGPFGGGWGAATDPRARRMYRVLRAVRIAAIVVAVVTLSLITGHFFWPIIPLFFLAQFLRFRIWRAGARNMAGPGYGGCGRHHHGGQGYGDQGYGGRGYGGDSGGAA